MYVYMNKMEITQSRTVYVALLKKMQNRSVKIY